MCTHAKLLQSCLTLWDPMDWSLPGASVHGIFQTRILEWVAMPSSRGSSWLRDQTHVSFVSCIGRWIVYHWTSLVAQMVKDPPAMRETWVRFWVGKTHSSILAWRTPMDRGAWRATDKGVAKSRTWLSDFHSLFTTSTLRSPYPSFISISKSL